MNSAMLTYLINRGFRGVLLLAVPVLMLAACQTTGGAGRNVTSGETPSESAGAPAHVIKYACDDGRKVDVTLNGPERAQLKINGATAALTAVRSASGAKFQSADGSITFWSKGNEATIDTVAGNNKQAHMVCTIVP